MKKIYLIAGVNGCGKSTLYTRANIKEILKETVRINTDEIVRNFGDWRNVADQTKASRIAINLRNDCFENGKSFNEETTLCGKTIIKQLDKAKNLGYETHLFYVGVNSPEIAKKRIEYRVSKGGHFIADDVVEKRYYESIENLEKNMYKFDYIRIYDNTENFKLCYHYSKEDNLHFVRKDLPKWFEKIIENYKEKILLREEKDFYIYGKN